MTKSQRRARCHTIIHGGAGLSGLTAGALTRTLVADEAALTLITVGMVTIMCRHVYGMEGLGESAIGVIVGKLLGTRMATKAITLLPGVGEYANAGTAFTLHETTGWLFHHLFEYQIRNKQEPRVPGASMLLGLFGLLLIDPEAREVLFEKPQEELLHSLWVDFFVANDQLHFDSENRAFVHSHGRWIDMGIFGEGTHYNQAFKTPEAFVKFVDVMKDKLHISDVDSLPIKHQAKAAYKVFSQLTAIKTGGV